MWEYPVVEPAHERQELRDDGIVHTGPDRRDLRESLVALPGEPVPHPCRSRDSPFVV
jgi:hypothetical protein